MRYFTWLRAAVTFLVLLSLPARAEECYRPDASDLTFAELRKDIEAAHINSAEQMLAFFARTPRYRPLVEYPVLERDSNALHADNVSATFPRIVLHEGNLALHLIGDPSKPGHELIEFVEFLPKDARFAFHVINFKLTGRPEMVLEDIDVKYEVPKPVQELYEKTIGQFAGCNDCHALGTRGLVPNWSPRSSLFKAYGSVDDQIPWQAFAPRGEPGNFEGDQFRNFLKIRDDATQGALYRWIQVKTATDHLDNVTFPDHPNRRFNDALYSRVRYGIARQILEDAEYPRLQYAIAGAFLGCGGIETFLPDAYRARHEAALAGKVQTEIPLDAIPRDRAYFEPKASASEGDAQSLTPEGMKVIEEGEMLRMGRLSPTEVLELGVHQRDRVERFFSAKGMPYFSLSSPGRAIERELASNAYESLMAKLRYLFAVRLKNGLNFPEESHGGNQQDAAFRTYRMDGGIEGVRQIASCHLSDPFLKANPDLDYFAGHPMHSRNLTIPLAAYCAKLKEKSLRALAE